MNYIFVLYDTIADGDDTWQVNNTYRGEQKIWINDDADGDEIIKVLCAEGVFTEEAKEGVSVDFSCSDGGYIEFFDDLDYYRPIGRLEQVD